MLSGLADKKLADDFLDGISGGADSSYSNDDTVKRTCTECGQPFSVPAGSTEKLCSKCRKELGMSARLISQKAKGAVIGA